MINLTTIRKRNGTLVPFDQNKIIDVITKAFKNVTGNEQMLVAENIRDQVVIKLEELHKGEDAGVPYVEQVQDVVEQAIMEAGYFEVAKHFILYRHEKIKERAEEKAKEIKKIEEGNAMIINRNGKQERFNEGVMRGFVKKMVVGYENTVSVDAIMSRTKMEIYDGISSTDLMKALILSCRGMIENDPAYAYVAAKMIRYTTVKELGSNDSLTVNYENYTEELVNKTYIETFVKCTVEGVQDKIYDARLLTFDLGKLAAAIRPERDFLFQYLGMQTLVDRYLVRNIEKGNKIIELPQTFWMRVAMGLAILETDKNEKAIEFYNMMSTLRVIPSTPTLFQSGTSYPQLSSCYLNTIDDTLESLAKVTYTDNAQLSKYSGGIATDWSYIRSSGAIVKKTRIESTGIIPFLKIANDVTLAINRSGRRRGATCAYLETWHYDIEEFLDLRKNTGDERRRTHDMNTANWIPDLFMQRVREDAEWTLFSPDEAKELHDTYGQNFKRHYENYESKTKTGEIRIFKTVKAKDLYKKMIMMIFETGHPWFTFKDVCNIRSPQDHVGMIHNSNLCTEITLNNSFEETAVCNLASLNLPRHFVDHGGGKKMDLEMLKDTIGTAMRMLDNVIDINLYPTIEGKTSNLKHRPIGLGIMGFHDALYELGLNYDSAEALKFADENQEFISYYAILASTELAKERGAYSTFPGSKWDRGILPVDTISLLEQERNSKIPVSKTGKMDWGPVRNSIKMYGMRNSNTMAIAPTATISNIAGSSPCIEAYYKNIYVKSNMSGEFTMINYYLVSDLKEIGMWNDEMLNEIKQAEGSVQDIMRIPAELRAKYKETFEIDSKVFINLAAFRGKWIDQSQSLNLFYKGTSGKDIGDMYMYAWDMGLKTTYYLRTLAASGIEKATVSISKAPEKAPNVIVGGAGPTLTPQATPSTYASYNTPIPEPPFVAAESETVKPEVNYLTQFAPVNTYKEIDTQALINNALSKIKANTEAKAESMNNSYVTNGSVKINGVDTKLCRILDPDCEACQ